MKSIRYLLTVIVITCCCHAHAQYSPTSNSEDESNKETAKWFYEQSHTCRNLLRQWFEDNNNPEYGHKISILFSIIDKRIQDNHSIYINEFSPIISAALDRCINSGQYTYIADYQKYFEKAIRKASNDGTETPFLKRYLLLTSERIFIRDCELSQDPDLLRYSKKWRMQRKARTFLYLRWIDEHLQAVYPASIEKHKRLKQSIVSYKIPIEYIKIPNAVSLMGPIPPAWITDPDYREKYKSEYYEKYWEYYNWEVKQKNAPGEYNKRYRPAVIAYIADLYGAKPYNDKELLSLLKQFKGTPDTLLEYDKTLEQDIWTRVKQIQRGEKSAWDE